MTKTEFLERYRARLVVFPWASSPQRLDKFMSSVANTIGVPGHTGAWNHDSDIARDIWTEAGFKRKEYALKRLRALELGQAGN